MPLPAHSPPEWTELFQGAYNKKDTSTFEALFDDNCIWVGASGQRFKGRDDIATHVVLDQSTGDIEFEGIREMALGSPAAVVSLAWQHTSPSGGATNGTLLMTLARIGGNWLCLTGAASKSGDDQAKGLFD